MKTELNKKQVWINLNQYHFNTLVPEHLWDHVVAFFGGDDAATKAFADKLSRKHNWQIDFAMLAVQEYKRFVFLGVTADFSVTPSKVIDTVWHEHILFTKGYSDFCNDVIGCAFNHYPELLPLEEQTAAYQKQYTRTLALYEHEFNSCPPDDIWGAPKFGRRYLSRRKKRVTTVDDSYTYDDIPLYALFGSSDSGDGGTGFEGFGGGDSDGGGAGSDWGSDGDSSDGGDGGGDGDGGGCSSGCGGGCGGD